MDNAIALQYQPTTALESPLNMMAKISAIRGSQQENQLRAAQMANFQSEIEKRNAMLPFEQAKARSEQETAKIAQGSAFGKLVGERLDLARRRLEGVSADAPDADAQYLAWHEQNHNDPVLAEYFDQIGVSAEKSRNSILSDIYNPDGSFNREGLRKKITESKLGVEATIKREDELAKEKETVRSHQATEAGTRYGQDLTAATTRRGQNIAADTARAGQESTARSAAASLAQAGDVELQGRLAAARKLGEANAGKAPGVTSPEAAKAFLASAGFDPKTNTDEVSQLIPQSTGGPIQTLGAKIAGGFNSTTSGQYAIGRLASRSSKLVLDLLGGKLGAGVSNADREFMLQAVGDVGNSMLPTGKRLAAWQDLRGRMIRLASGGADTSLGATAPIAAAPTKASTGWSEARTVSQ